jgi:hypothetical protein
MKLNFMKKETSSNGVVQGPPNVVSNASPNLGATILSSHNVVNNTYTSNANATNNTGASVTQGGYYKINYKANF